MTGALVPTARLRWLKRPSSRPRRSEYESILQQWFAEDLPGYMRDTAKGEWRDVELVVES